MEILGQNDDEVNVILTVADLDCLRVGAEVIMERNREATAAYSEKWLDGERDDLTFPMILMENADDVKATWEKACELLEGFSPL